MLRYIDSLHINFEIYAHTDNININYIHQKIFKNFLKNVMFQYLTFFCLITYSYLSFNDYDTLKANSSFRVPASSSEEQHAPSKLHSSWYLKELKIPARLRVEKVENGEGDG